MKNRLKTAKKNIGIGRYRRFRWFFVKLKNFQASGWGKNTLSDDVIAREIGKSIEIIDNHIFRW